MWAGRRPNESSTVGWTNYTPCFPLEVKNLFSKVNSSQSKYKVAHATRYLEISGSCISLVALVISLCIFVHFRSLHNKRTKIHKHLFSAMLLQVSIRLILYIDQFFVRGNLTDDLVSPTVRGIDNMPYLCEFFYVLLEYAINVMFVWMFIEGLYLNNLVSANVSTDRISDRMYIIIGWGVPFVLSSIWATFTAIHYYSQDTVIQCWYGYNFLSYFWIIQGPRIFVITVNLIFLLNILRVLVLKLRRSRSSEVNKVRKAVRAAFVLLPLLGIPNALDMIQGPLDGDFWQFAVWSYTTHFLRSFQGFFIALIYCFFNGEVRMVLRKYRENRRAVRETRRRYANLFRSNGRRPATPALGRRIKMRTEGTQTRETPLRQYTWTRRSRALSRDSGQISVPTIEGNRRSTGTYTETALTDLGRARCNTSDHRITTTTATIETETREPESAKFWKKIESDMKNKRRRQELMRQSVLTAPMKPMPKNRKRKGFKTAYHAVKLKIEDMDEIRECSDSEME